MSGSPAIRLSLGLVLVTSCILLIGDLAGLTPGRTAAVLQARKQLTEALAVQYAGAAERRDWASLRGAMDQLLRRNGSVRSVALRSADGTILARAGDHEKLWKAPPEGKSTPSHTQVPILRGQEPWGQVEISFTPVTMTGVAGFWQNPIGRLIGFVGLIGFVAYLLFLRRTLRHLDPSSVIPSRVRAVLDTLAEGVVLLDGDERIVLANDALANRLDRPADSLIGISLGKFPWRTVHDQAVDRRRLPWRAALQSGESSTGTPLVLPTASGERMSYMVNSAPIVDDRGVRRGALVTLDDVTELEEKKVALETALDELHKSQEEIRLHNEELKVLATRDPLTGCLNRRSFIEIFEEAFTSAQEGGPAVHCMMADIDHFKAVNDTHGHAVGDRVIEVVARFLEARLGEGDAIARWGGEEFCILLRNRTWNEAEAEAELARKRVDSADAVAVGLPEGLKISVSMGIASLETAPRNSLELVEQADRALYASKDGGRNRVTVYSAALLD